jgi:hypothetical protein
MTQQEMVTRLMQDTRLNQTFAEQALAGNGWDYTRTITDFRNLQAMGKITSDMLIL